MNVHELRTLGAMRRVSFLDIESEVVRWSLRSTAWIWVVLFAERLGHNRVI